MDPAVVSAGQRYFAFISYSHADRRWAKWLHRNMEGYRVPKPLQTGELASRLVGHRMIPMFMDREELSTSANLAESIRVALEKSDCLIVICSPAAAQSRWVNEEVRSFAALGRSQKILCLIVAGEPGGGAAQAPEMECFPPALRDSEPLAADVRAGADGKRSALLKLIAGVLGVKLDDLRRRDQMRRQRRLAWISAAATAGCVVLSGLAAAAWLARNEAERQRQLAVRQSITAQRTADFLKSLFQVSDPSEARGKAVTAREILDRGVRQIDESLKDEPAVKSAMLLTMGEVYRGLGLYQQSSVLLSRLRSSPGQAPADWIRETLALAVLEQEQGNLEQSDLHFTEAEQRYGKAGLNDSSLKAQILLGRAGALSLNGRYAEARTYLDQALASAQEADPSEVTATVYATRAMTDYYEGNLEAAELSYKQAYEMRVSLSGETHPKAQEILNGLAAIAYQRHEYRRAEAAWMKLLDVDIRVLGAHHPDLAITRNNLGRLWLERRQYAKAQAALTQAVADLQAQQSTTDTMVFAYTNLALARMGSGDGADVTALLHSALRVAEINDHPLQGPIRVYEADALCRRGRSRQGIELLEQARPLVAQRYVEEPWRMAQLETVQADCLLVSKQADMAANLLDSNLPTLLARWPADSAFGSDGIARAIRVYGANNEAEKLARYQALRR